MCRAPSAALAKQAGDKVAASRPIPSSSSISRTSAASGSLARFDLAAGKLPQPGHRPPRRALLQQDSPVAVDQRRGDHDHCRIFFQKWPLRGRVSLTTQRLGPLVEGAIPPDHPKGQAMKRLFGIFNDERGATAVEYGLILALIFLAVVGAVSTVASTTIEMWNNVSNRGDQVVTALNVWKPPSHKSNLADPDCQKRPAGSVDFQTWNQGDRKCSFASCSRTKRARPPSNMV